VDCFIASKDFPDRSRQCRRQRLRTFVGRLVAEPSSSVDVMVLWVLHTWFVEVARPFLVSPRLVLRGVCARADHARALRVLSWLVPMPLIVSRAIARHVLEAVAAERPTLLIDDNDGGTPYRRDMRAALAAGALADGRFHGVRDGSGFFVMSHVMAA
jgi:hypothetical protein